MLVCNFNQTPPCAESAAGTLHAAFATACTNLEPVLHTIRQEQTASAAIDTIGEALLQPYFKFATGMFTSQYTCPTASVTSSQAGVCDHIKISNRLSHAEDRLGDRQKPGSCHRYYQTSQKADKENSRPVQQMES